jgi:hypothetical protein
MGFAQFIKQVHPLESKVSKTRFNCSYCSLFMVGTSNQSVPETGPYTPNAYLTNYMMHMC